MYFKDTHSAEEKTTFRLEVYIETHAQAWRALLWYDNAENALEFDSPLDLARHLANLGLEHRMPVSMRRGLR
jgi:hypothetical protein